MKARNIDNVEFEVTEADMALVAPLGVDNGWSESTQQATLRENLKDFLRELPAAGLPTGYWDAWLDEGDWSCGKLECQMEGGCRDVDHLVCTRPSDPAQDDLFIRLHTRIDGGISSAWDLEIFTRRGDDDNVFATEVALGGDVYTPEQCMADLSALMAVFRFFVQQGKL